MSITRYDIWYDRMEECLQTDVEQGCVDWVHYNDHISEVKALQEEISLLKSKLNFDWDSIK